MNKYSVIKTTLISLLLVLFSFQSWAQYQAELQMMWKETALFHNDGNGNGVRVDKGSYPYSYMPVAPFDDFIRVEFDNPGSPVNNTDVAEEKQNGALKTGKNVGGTIRLIAQPGVSIQQAYAFGKIENGAKDRIAVRYGTASFDGSGNITSVVWKENWYPLYWCWENAYSEWGQLGADATLDLQQHVIYHGNRYNSLDVNVIEFRNVNSFTMNGNDVQSVDVTNNLGLEHPGLFLRNMALTVSYSDGSKQACAALVGSPHVSSGAINRDGTYIEVVPRQDVTLSVTATDLAGNTGGTYKYQWYKCNALGGGRTLLPGQKSSTLTIPAAQQTINGVFYYVCHVTLDCGNTSASPVFCVNTIPEENLILHYSLPESKLGAASWESGMNSNYVPVRTAAGWNGDVAADFSGHTYDPNGHVDGMTDKIKMGSTKHDAVPIVFQFTPGWDRYTRINDIVLEVQPVTYTTEMFYAELVEVLADNREVFLGISGQAEQPTPGVGTLLHFSYHNEGFNIMKGHQYKLKLYAWDPAHQDAYFRINQVVAIYGENSNALPAPELHWVVSPQNGSSNSPSMRIYARSNNSTNSIRYSLQSWEDERIVTLTTGASNVGNDKDAILNYVGPGVVTITAHIYGDGTHSNSGAETGVATEATVTKTIIVDPHEATEACSKPDVIITGQNDNNETRTTFCASDTTGIEAWRGFTATATVEALQTGETMRLVWLDSYDQEVASIETNSSNSVNLLFKPTKVGAYRAIAMVYELENRKTTSTTAASVQYRLLQAPERPTIDGPSHVERTGAVTLTATSSGARSYQWYIQRPGESMELIEGATGQTYTWQTRNGTPTGRYYFYVEAFAGNSRNGETLDACNKSSLSGHAAVRLDEPDGCEWHYLMNPEDARNNFVPVSNRAVLTEGANGPRVNIVSYVGDNIRPMPSIAGSNMDLTYATPVTNNLHIQFAIPAGTSSSVYMVAKAQEAGRHILLERKDGSVWREVENVSISHEVWTTYSSISLETEGEYRMRIDGNAQVAFAASEICHSGDCGTNIPIIEVDNSNGCSSVTLRATDTDLDEKVDANAARIHWFNNGEHVLDGGGHHATGFTLVATLDGRYSAAIESDGCYTYSSDVEVELGQAPHIIAQPAVLLGSQETPRTNVNVTAGTSFTIPTSFSDATSYQWYRSLNSDMSGRTPVSSSTGRTSRLLVSIPTSEPDGRQYYYVCTAYSECDQVTTDPICITVVNTSPTCLDLSTNSEDFRFEQTEADVVIGTQGNLGENGFPQLINNYGLTVRYEVISTGDAGTVATVNETTGYITTSGAGTITIRATTNDLRVCEQREASTQFTLVVVGDAVFLPALSANRTNIPDCNTPATITLQKRKGANYRSYTVDSLQHVTWYRDGQPLTFTGATLTTNEPGEYYAIDRNTPSAAFRSNTVKITGSMLAPHIEMYSPLHYYRDGFAYAKASGDHAAVGSPIHDVCRIISYNYSVPREKSWTILEAYNTRTPHIKLTNADLWLVSNPADPTLVQLDLVALRSRMEGNAKPAVVNDTILVRIAPIRTCATTTNLSDYDASQAVTVQVIVVEKDIVSVVYVKTGVTHGEFYITPAPNEEPLYEYLAQRPEYYRVAVTNGVADFNLSRYSAFDVVVIAPNLNALTSDAAALTQLNALAGLINHKPLMVLNGELDNLRGWRDAGFLQNRAATPPPAHDTVTFNCIDHPILQRMSRKDDIIAARGVIKMLTVSATNDISVRGYYNSHLKPYFFERIAKLDGTDYVALSEFYRDVRQIDTRTVLLPLTTGAISCLTDDGKELVHQSIQYLLVSDEGQLGDCGYRFNNGAKGDGDHSWHTASNWAPFYDDLPGELDEVIIEASCEVRDRDHIAIAKQITLSDAEGKEGFITVAPKATLATPNRIYQGTSHGAVTDPERLHVLSDATGAGTLIHANTTGVTKARVDFYSKAKGAPSESKWQWMTTPFSDVTDVQQHYYGAWMYEWNDVDRGWTTEIVNGSKMTPFGGYTITQAESTTYSMTGTLVPTGEADHPIRLTHSVDGSLHLIGNSWTAPIVINRFQDADFENLEKTIWLFNTGLDALGSGGQTEIGAGSDDVTSEGTYVAIPIHVAGKVGALQVIPSLQAFQVKATGPNAVLHLHYDGVVRVNTAPAVATPMRARGTVNNVYMGDQERDYGITESLRIAVRGERYADALYLLRHPDCTDGYEDGYDGEKILSNNFDIPMLFAANDYGWWQVSTQSQLAGTTLGFFQGEDFAYTLSFEYDGDDPLWLYDSETDIYTRITNKATYEFASNDYAPQFRFLLTDNNPNEMPDVTTGIVDMREETNSLLFTNTTGLPMQISVYDVTGKLCQQTTTSSPLYEVTLPEGQGVFMVQAVVGDKREVRKIVRE